MKLRALHLKRLRENADNASSRTIRLSKKAPKANYGIAEWYGHLFRRLDNKQRDFLAYVEARDKGRREIVTKLAAASMDYSFLESAPEKLNCRFLESAPDLAPGSGVHCNKKGGVCSMRNFHSSNADISHPISAVCPHRFLENRTIITEVGRSILDTENPLVAKEIPFLKRDRRSDDPSVDRSSSDVGRIDLVLVDPNDLENWCAVEIQAVYFSGGAWSKDFARIRAHTGNGIPIPGAIRRPDFRSSGPKRLMPQLQIKVPTLRRWGKKMVVVVDEPFFESLSAMDPVDDVSNCDIVWLVVEFVEQDCEPIARLKVSRTVYTTLERAVEGLTAGVPSTLREFQTKLSEKLSL